MGVNPTRYAQEEAEAQALYVIHKSLKVQDNTWFRLFEHMI